MVAGTSDEGYIGCCAALAAWDHRDRLPAITAPTLVVAGADDAATPVDPHARTIAAGIPGARLEVVPGAHLATSSRPTLSTGSCWAHLCPYCSRQVGRDRRLHRRLVDAEPGEHAVPASSSSSASRMCSVPTKSCPSRSASRKVSSSAFFAAPSNGISAGTSSIGRGQRRRRRPPERLRRDALRHECLHGEPVRLGQQAQDQVLRPDLGVARGPGLVLRRHDDVAGARGEPPEVLRRLLGTNRFWTACLVTPMLRPMSVHDAPARRARSTKWPTRWSPVSSRASATIAAPATRSSGSAWACSTPEMRSSSRGVPVIRTGSVMSSTLS